MIITAVNRMGDGLPLLEFTAENPSDQRMLTALCKQLEAAQLKAIPLGLASYHNCVGRGGNDKGVFEMSVPVLLGGMEIEPRKRGQG